MNTIDFDFLINTIKPRPYNSHKGSMGCLFSICGSYGMAGAQILCCNGTLRSGIGLLKTAVVDSIYPIVASNVFEAVFTPLKDNGEGTFSYSDISKIMEAIKISKKTCGIIKQNLVFSISVKLLILIFSIIGIGGMWQAVFADVGVTILTIFNTLRILK